MRQRGEKIGSEDPPLQRPDEGKLVWTIGNGSRGKKRMSSSLLVYWMLIRTEGADSNERSGSREV